MSIIRRRKVPRIFLSSSLVVTLLFVFTFTAFLRVSFKFGFESRMFKTGPDNQEFFSKHSLHADRSYFMQGGLIRPQERKSHEPRPRLWPHEDPGDRIIEQLMYVPSGYSEFRNQSSVPLKKILLYFGLSGWGDLQLGRKVFQKEECPVDTCTLTTDHSYTEDADLILFKDRFNHPKHKRPSKQIWLLFLLECPQHTQSFTHLSGLFNWTATYRHDSDIVAPYEKFVPYPNQATVGLSRNYASGKRRKVAWFVSNCAARNRRLIYAKELAKHIDVHLFGKCSHHRCPKNKAKKCFQMLNSQYKFYLAFENCNCKDYITEKLFVNGLGHNIIPIVMGARPEDYERSAPPNSYIHVEYFSGPQSLAEYLHTLDKNDTLYNSYFRWKSTGEFINTKFWCRVCALLHAPSVPKVYTDLEAWWAGKGTCAKDQWRKQG